MLITNLTNRPIVRAPINPLDKATIVSIFPQEINETKWTLTPGTWRILPGKYESPSVLVVGPSSWYREIDESQPFLEIPVSSVSIADSIVKDYANGLLACDMGDRMPGLFYLPGSLSAEEIKKNHRVMLDKAKVKQDEWFKALIRLADVMWARTNGNPLAIGEMARLAAVELGQKKEWLTEHQAVELIKCLACGQLNNSAIIVCPNCKVIIDKKRFDEMKLQFAS